MSRNGRLSTFGQPADRKSRNDPSQRYCTGALSTRAVRQQRQPSHLGRRRLRHCKRVTATIRWELSPLPSFPGELQGYGAPRCEPDWGAGPSIRFAASRSFQVGCAADDSPTTGASRERLPFPISGAAPAGLHRPAVAPHSPTVHPKTPQTQPPTTARAQGAS
ncbi:hypothetical protein ACCO45_010436 [Purpureocillium lilacinum]|uniref:Uncharacterized protein n=1 Tax=Purpureocillium lilacinum TaxID=33203 RepID=A0ACC4DFS3_PURLI